MRAQVAQLDSSAPLTPTGRATRSGASSSASDSRAEGTALDTSDSSSSTDPGEGGGDGDRAFWLSMRLLLAQLDGLQEGYEAARQAQLEQQQQQQDGEGAADGTSASDGRLPPLDRRAFLLVQAVGDLGDLGQALDPRRGVNWEELTPHEVLTQVRWRGVGCVGGLKRLSAASSCPGGRQWCWCGFGAADCAQSHGSAWVVVGQHSEPEPPVPRPLAPPPCPTWSIKNAPLAPPPFPATCVRSCTPPAGAPR